MATNGTLAFKGFATDGSGSVRYVEVAVDGKAVAAYLAKQIAGERNPNSAVNSYLVTRQECKPTRIAATGTQILTSGPAHLFGFLSNATTGGNVSFFDSNASGVTATAIFVQPTNANLLFTSPIRFENGVVLSNTVSGVANDITVLWKEI